MSVINGIWSAITSRRMTRTIERIPDMGRAEMRLDDATVSGRHGSANDHD